MRTRRPASELPCFSRPAGSALEIQADLIDKIWPSRGVSRRHDLGARAFRQRLGDDAGPGVVPESVEIICLVRDTLALAVIAPAREDVD